MFATAGKADVRGVGAEPVEIVPGAARLIVVTGCNHPGVVNMVKAARAACGGKRERLLPGGFHMPNDSEARPRVWEERGGGWA